MFPVQPRWPLSISLSDLISVLDLFTQLDQRSCTVFFSIFCCCIFYFCFQHDLKLLKFASQRVNTSTYRASQVNTTDLQRYLFKFDIFFVMFFVMWNMLVFRYLNNKKISNTIRHRYVFMEIKSSIFRQLNISI